MREASSYELIASSAEVEQDDLGGPNGLRFPLVLQQ